MRHVSRASPALKVNIVVYKSDVPHQKYEHPTLRIKARTTVLTPSKVKGYETHARTHTHTFSSSKYMHTKLTAESYTPSQ